MTRSLFTALAWAAVCGGAISARGDTSASVGDSRRALAFPALTVAAADGSRSPLFSLEAYRSEFRFLRSVCHGYDLSGPPVDFDPWVRSVREAEWPLMGFSYFGYACGNLAQHDPVIRNEALAEMRWLIGALQTPRLSGFITLQMGSPFGSEIHPSVFVHGHFLNLALRYRALSKDARYDMLIHRVASALAKEFANSDQGILRTYREMWFLSDNCPALSALTRYDAEFDTSLSSASAKFLRSVRANYLDLSNGLFCTYIGPAQHMQLQGARGISTMYALIYLRDIEPQAAHDQYSRAKTCFLRDAAGFAAVREFPEGVPEHPDVDTGPLVLGFGPSASGFAIPAAAVMDDRETAWKLLKSVAMVGGPVLDKAGLRFTAMPMVGQAVIFYGKTLLLEPEERLR